MNYMTVGQLRKALAAYPDDTKVSLTDHIMGSVSGFQLEETTQFILPDQHTNHLLGLFQDDHKERIETPVLKITGKYISSRRLAKGLTILK